MCFSERRDLVLKLDNSTSPSLDVGYVYNESGLRIRKTVNGVEHSYTYDGYRLVYESYPNHTLRYLYDERGLLASLVYTSGGTSTRYHYVRDVTLNIFGLIDDSGNLVVRYTYDAWGNILSTTGSLASTLGVINPFRYKGYYYDSETGMYYCQTRYYVPQWCRWLSADSPKYLDIDSPEGINLFAYCANNPIINVDPSGKFVLLTFLIGMGIAALSGALVGAFSYTLSEGISYALTGKWSWSWSQFAGSVLGGAIGGAISVVPGVGVMLTAGITGFASTAIGMGLQNKYEGAKYSFAQIMFVSSINGLVSASMAGLSDTIKIKGLNSGRNSYSAILKAINTKFFNGTISKISYNTFSKALTYNMLGSLIGSGVS